MNYSWLLVLDADCCLRSSLLSTLGWVCYLLSTWGRLYSYYTSAPCMQIMELMLLCMAEAGIEDVPMFVVVASCSW